MSSGHRRSRRRLGSRFDGADEDPRASLVNLVDVMLVFVCGLLAALTAGGQAVLRPVEVERGREIAPPDQGAQVQGAGMKALGQVYLDPQTGKMILIESPTGAAR